MLLKPFASNIMPHENFHDILTNSDMSNQRFSIILILLGNRCKECPNYILLTIQNLKNNLPPRKISQPQQWKAR